MRIRPYEPADRAACLALFDGNVPDYFTGADRADFAAFLERVPATFLVIEERGIVACGGWYLDAERAGLAWGMVERSLHARGLGRALLEERLRRIREDGRARVIDLRTTQKVQGFYERLGFGTTRVLRDGFGPGLDRVEMALVLR